MAHGVHPNFMDKHEENHRPQMQKGLVIKHNANQRYATSGVTSFLFKEVAKIHNLPIQVPFYFAFIYIFFTRVFPIPPRKWCFPASSGDLGMKSYSDSATFH